MKDPLTIRKITCKSTGLPVSRVRDIKKKLRRIYEEPQESYKELFERGQDLMSCFVWNKQEEGHEFWDEAHRLTLRAFR